MTQQHNILVIGGTGKTGRRVADLLQQKEQHVRIGSRSQDPPFDWQDPATWTAALEGMDRVYITYHPDLAVPGAYEAITGLVAAAKKAGVQKLVLLSGKGEREAERCEDVVATSGLDYTLVRASWFNQNFSESFFLEPVLSGRVAMPMPEARIPFVDADDIAEVAVEVLLNDAHNGQTYEISGPRLLTFAEAVSEIAEATGRNIQFQPVSLEDYAQGMEAQGVPAPVIWLFKYLFTEVLGNPRNSEVTRDVAKVLGRPAKDFRTYAREVAATGAWTPKVTMI